MTTLMHDNYCELEKNVTDLKCGEIYFTNSAKFNFICSFCEKPYKTSNGLLQHIHSNHLNVLEEYDDLGDDDTGLPIEYISPNKIQEIDTTDNSPIKMERREEFCDKFENFLCEFKDNDDDLEHLDETVVSDEEAFLVEEDLNEHESPPQNDNIVNFKVEPDMEINETVVVVNEAITENIDTKKSSTNASGLKTCYICAKVFIGHQKLTLHLTRAHKIDPNFQCKECKQIFCTQAILSSHMQRHNTERKHICEYCNARFSDPSNLKVHVMRHKGIKPHKCRLCVKRFHSTTELKIHLRTHTGEKPFICEICGKKFTNSGHLVSHKRRHTNERNYACVLCNKRFFDMKLLKDHMVCHSNERPFSCEKCDATFQRKKALIQHYKLHSETKAYECHICGKSFAQNAGLYSHSKSHRKC